MPRLSKYNPAAKRSRWEETVIEAHRKTKGNKNTGPQTLQQAFKEIEELRALVNTLLAERGI